MYYAKEVVEQLKNSTEILIFGAGAIAEEAANCLLEKPYELKIAGFLVSDKAKNPKLTYTVGKDALCARFISKLPQELLNFIIKTVMHIKKNLLQK